MGWGAETRSLPAGLMTLADYVDRWLTAHTDRLSPNSVLAYRSALSNHVVPWLGDFALGELTVAAHPPTSGQ
jgi:hypothetical protein